MSDGSGGYLLALLADSFIVRAAIGTLAALLLALATIRLVPIRSALARRVLVLAPVITAAVAAVASIGGQFVPTIMVMGGAGATAGGGGLDVLGETRQMTEARSVGVMLALYVVVAAILLSRRVVGAVRVRRMLRRAVLADPRDRCTSALRRLAEQMLVATPELRYVSDCPGGAFTVGRRSARIALDPELAATLDDRELQGLLAHELAHIRRADPLTGLLVGVMRDLAFFVPGIHVAARWLSIEQEESADEMAADATRRPGALASGLLKAWQGTADRAGGTRVPAGACAAAGGGWGHRRLFAGIALRFSPRALAGSLAAGGVMPWSGPDALTVITRRVERLIQSLPLVSAQRRRMETVCAVTITVLAATAALAAPAWFSHRHADLVGFFYLSNSQAVAADSPAMATFRALAGSTSTAMPAEIAEPAAPLGAPSTAEDLGASARHESAAACPCVATPSQLAAAQSASPADRPGSAWGSRAWTLQSLRHQSDLEATRRVLLMDSAAQQMGFLTAGRSGQGSSPVAGVAADGSSTTASAAGESAGQQRRR